MKEKISVTDKVVNAMRKLKIESGIIACMEKISDGDFEKAWSELEKLSPEEVEEKLKKIYEVK